MPTTLARIRCTTDRRGGLWTIALATLVLGAATAAPGASQTPVNVWLEAGGGVTKAGHAADVGARGALHVLVGNWGLSGRAIYTTPRNTGLSRNPALRGDPDDEFKEFALLAERVLFTGETSLMYLGVGRTRTSGVRWLEPELGQIIEQDFDGENGWTAEVGFEGQLARFAGVGGAISVSPKEEETLVMFSLSMLVGKIIR